MSFGTPLNLLWLLPAAGAVTLLYMLRRPRRDIIVPSTVFWRTLPQETVQVKRLQKLTPQLLYFLQLLAASLIVLAAAQPQLRRAAPGGICLAIILDNGVTMQARGSAEGSSRFTDARQTAEAIVQNDLVPSGSACLVTTAPPRLVASATRDKAALLQAIQDTSPGDGASDLPGASLIAAAALRQRSTVSRAQERSVIISDGCWSSAADASGVVQPLAFSAPSVDQVAIPSGGPQNIGIMSLVAQRNPVKPQSRLQVFAQVAATGEPAGQADFDLTENGRRVASRTISTHGSAATILTFSLPAPQSASSLIATVKPIERDDLAVDNTAYAVLPAAGAARVLLIGGSQGADPGLERVLSLLPGVQTDVTRLSAIPKSGVPSGYALYVLDAEGDDDSSDPLPAFPGSSMVFSARQSQFVQSQADVGSRDEIVDWERSHPALRFADLTGIALSDSKPWQTVGVWQPLIESQQGIVAASQDLGSGGPRSICFSFSPQTSGFDSVAAFPIVISNSVNWLLDSGGSAATAGAPIVLAPTRGGWTISRSAPAGSPERVGQNLCDEHDSPCSEGDTYRAGIYSAVSTAGNELFARNADSSVSLTPQAHTLLPPYESAGSPYGARVNQTITTSLIGWAGAICLIALLLEWSVSYSPKPTRRSAV